MPDVVRDDLVLRVLLDIADLHGGGQLRYFVQRLSPVVDGAAPGPCRGQLRLGLPKKRRLTAAGFAADDDVFALLHGKGDFI